MLKTENIQHFIDPNSKSLNFNKLKATEDKILVNPNVKNISRPFDDNFSGKIMFEQDDVTKWSKIELTLRNGVAITLKDLETDIMFTSKGDKFVNDKMCWLYR